MVVGDDSFERRQRRLHPLRTIVDRRHVLEEVHLRGATLGFGEVGREPPDMVMEIGHVAVDRGAYRPVTPASIVERIRSRRSGIRHGAHTTDLRGVHMTLRVPRNQRWPRRSPGRSARVAPASTVKLS
jgi:hypothetical protein